MKELVYILGGSGFIGKHLSSYLMQDYQVVVFDQWIDAAFFAQKPLITTHSMDLIASKIPDELPVPTFIINLASPLVTASREVDYLDKMTADNLKILLNLFNRFHDKPKLKLMLQFGSIEEYGNGDAPFSETQREMPNSTYALLKQTTTNAAMMLNRNHNFPVAVLRPGNLFGSGQNKNRFIAYVLDSLIRGESLEVTPCEQKRDFLSIQDFCEILKEILLIHKSFVGEIVNVASGKNVALRDIIAFMQKLTGSSSEVLYGKLPYRENEIMDQRCSIDKLERLLGKKLDYDFWQRLREYIEMEQTSN
ncbi:MAG: NAD(P)-dependent oxidoreductase [Paludibacter sp.]|nr:NAD(P)-dependent oxidoreductase [Paludibacter sp.]